MKSGRVIQQWFNRHRSGDPNVTGIHGGSQQGELLPSIYPEVYILFIILNLPNMGRVIGLI